MPQLAISYLSTTSSQDTFLHLLDWSLQMCQTALQLCLSQELSRFEQIVTNICVTIHYVQFAQRCKWKNIRVVDIMIASGCEWSERVTMMLRLPVLGGAQIIAFAGLIETTGFFQASSTTSGRGPREGQFSMKDSTETGEPGNYGVGFPNFLGKVEDPEARKSKLAAELANGRLAMMATRQHISMFYATMERLERAKE